METNFGSGGSPFFEGVIYAPAKNGDWEKRSSCKDVQVYFQSNPDFFGSMVVGSVHFQGGGGGGGGLGFEYDRENLENQNISVMPDGKTYIQPPDLTYLNVVQYDIQIEESE